MPTPATITTASKSSILTRSTFKGYDLCCNPYVGCEFGCSYCYVRFFVKDPDKDWGEFVRVREHLANRLPHELERGHVSLGHGNVIHIDEARLVIGTMTDPYQPVEKKARITRTALQILTDEELPQFRKVGIFTRSPLVLQDLGLICKLPQARVHFTVTPFPPPVLRSIEPYSPLTARRWDTVKKLKEAGLRVHVNVSPVMPGMSEEFIEEFAKKLAELRVDEYFVDPMQPYKESMDAFRQACLKVPGLDWDEIERTMMDKQRYLAWKNIYRQAWDVARAKHQHLAPNQLPIWSDHENKVWVDMRTGQQMSHRHYGDEANDA